VPFGAPGAVVVGTVEAGGVGVDTGVVVVETGVVVVGAGVVVVEAGVVGVGTGVVVDALVAVTGGTDPLPAGG
jgi:hypothetical protein